MTRSTATPDPDARPPEEEGREAEARRQPIVDAWISQQVFALYDGKKMTKQDERDARLLAAQWQLIFEEKVTREQLIVCTRGIIQMMDAIYTEVKGVCPGCGK